MGFANKHCDEIRELLAAYSMGATDPEETALVERHLPDCPDAIAELSEYLALNEAMLYLPELKQQRAEPSVTQVPSPSTRHAHTPPTYTIRREEGHTKPTLTEKLTTQTQPVVATGEEKVRRVSFAWVYRLVGAAAILTLLATNAFWAQRVQELDNELAIAAAVTPEVVEVVETVEVVVTQEVVVIQEATPEVIEVLVTPEIPQLIQGEQVQHRAVAADIEGHGSVSAIFAWDEQTQAGAFYVAGLENSSQERLYQLWLIREEETTLVGPVVVDDEETGVLLFQVEAFIDEYSTFLLTTEPENDSSQRSPLISGQL